MLFNLGMLTLGRRLRLNPSGHTFSRTGFDPLDEYISSPYRLPSSLDSADAISVTIGLYYRLYDSTTGWGEWTIEDGTVGTSTQIQLLSYAPDAWDASTAVNGLALTVDGTDYAVEISTSSQLPDAATAGYNGETTDNGAAKSLVGTHYPTGQIDNVAVFGDGTGYFQITGLLTTDTISVTAGDTPTCTTDGRLDFAASDETPDIHISRGGVEIMHLLPAAGDYLWDEVSGAGFAAVNFTGAAVAQSDIGYDHNANGFSVADGSTLYADSGATTLVPAGSIVPAGSGYTSTGEAFPTQYQGPIAQDVQVAQRPAGNFDGTGYFVLTGETIGASSWGPYTIHFIPTSAVLGAFLSGSGVGMLELRMNANQTCSVVSLSVSARLTTSNAATLNEVNTLVVSMSAGVVTAVLNGVTTTASSVPDFTASVLSYLGKRASGAPFNGVIKDIITPTHHYCFANINPDINPSATLCQDIGTAETKYHATAVNFTGSAGVVTDVTKDDTNLASELGMSIDPDGYSGIWYGPKPDGSAPDHMPQSWGALLNSPYSFHPPTDWLDSDISSPFYFKDLVEAGWWGTVASEEYRLWFGQYGAGAFAEAQDTEVLETIGSAYSVEDV